ncbi:V-type ATPase subunit [Streptococcus pyogenes]|uniref:V-type ATPase subunit n=1 Tax=Streptococcus pyogenes TaxID=1314 RepID=UPI00109CD6E5|nr:V-type ATPase subunit [Streptococcus pyogenes]VGQ57104.1 ATP synthase (C/AC39) subunit [Streptococcus pyogenes]VGQ69074.1 ATP synthase (C/AC39) subunit [Streptococcus pyogenes]VGU87708.1 ATP synthase (C/AC39) subunit [Streptococcus pyogenes]VGV00288.1 ATP synthase (C/AC39) subunit [Streptococcus pyogenes]VGV06695.1 ATP synthase (C/AC39) subunit [Streptococcus pyogenes]
MPTFLELNTTISVKEKELLTKEQFDKLLQAPNTTTLARLLHQSVYHLTVDDLNDLDRLESILMAELTKTYRWAFAETPQPDIVQLFTLRYTYHNVKVLLKAKASQADLSHLLLPIGDKPLVALEHLIRTMTSDEFPKEVVTEIQSIWAEYQDYQDIRVLEIGTDLAYFKALKQIAQRLGDPVFQQAVLIVIDLYNLITVRRAKSQNKPISFMMQLLSDEASRPSKTFITLEDDKDLMTWFENVTPDSYMTALKPYSEKLRQGTLQTTELEYLVDECLYHLFAKAKYQVDGPYVLARFLLAKSFEVKNLRLLAAALANDLPKECVIERMRPIA